MIDVTDPDLLPLIQNPAYHKAEVSKDGGYYYKCVNRRIRVCLRQKHTALLTDGHAKPLVDPEEGLLEAIEKEKLLAEKAEEGNDDDDDDDEDEEEEGEEGISTVRKENAVKEAMQAMDKPGSSKRLTQVVDEYMDELVKGEPLHGK